jgi:hypothetical protein
LTDDFNKKPTKAVFIPHRSRLSIIKQEDFNTERSVDQKRRSSETSKRSNTAPSGLETPDDLEAALFDDKASRGESAMANGSSRMYSLSEMAECHSSAPAIFDISPHLYSVPRQGSQQEAYSGSINEDQESLSSKLSELQQTKDDLEAKMTQYKVELKSTNLEQQSSNRRLREVLKLKRDTTQRLRELESTMGQYEGRLKAAEDEARVLRRGSIDDAVRIIQLECQNAELAEQLQRSSSQDAHSII